MARNDIAPALVELGIDAVEAEEIERQIRENRLENAGLDGVHWWLMQRWSFEPVDAVREARLGWWLSPVIDVAYKRLLDARYEAEPDEDLGGAIVRVPVVTWDAAADRFVEDAKSLLPIWQGTLKRAWVEAWRAWPRFSVQPDIPPTLPDFSSFKSLLDYYTRVRPHGIDPGHPAHVLRIFLEAIDEAIKGGPGSGYHAPHVGLPGVHGGSRPREEAGYAAYVYEKQKYGKKPKESKRKPRQAGDLPKEYPPGTPESIEAVVAEMSRENTQGESDRPTAEKIYADLLKKAWSERRTVLMPDEWPALPEDAERNLGEFNRDVTYNAYESLRIYDASGELVTHQYGDESSVYLPENIEISPGSVLTHNHPTLVSSLSDADVITSLSHDVRQIRATAGEYVWTLDLPVFTSPAERDQVIEEVKEAFRFARAEMDGVIFPQINSGMMSVADANHIASGGLLDKFFMDIYGTEHGFVLTREHVGNSDGLSEADVAIVQRVRKDATTGFQFMNRLAVYEDDDTRFDSGTHRNNGIHFTAFRIAIKDGAEGVLRVGPTLTTKLTFKRKLTDGDFAEIKRKYDMLLSAYSENAKESVSSSAYTNMAAFNIPSKVWRDVAKAYPDLLDFHVDYTPGRDPLDMIDRLLMNEDNPNRPKWVTLKAWDESQVNRHPAGTPVDSGTGAGGGRFAPKENAGDADKEPARVWQDKRQAAAESVPTKLDVGALGERMVAAIFEHLMETPFRTLNDGRSNAPLDLFGDHMAVEVKAGLASNQDGAQKWRSTIGEPGKAEKALLAQMGAEEKREHNAWKRAEILRRKQAFAEQLSKRTPDGQPVDPVTIGLIFAPDLRTVDLYVIDGYHLEMRWSQYATEKNLLATYRVDEWLN